MKLRLGRSATGCEDPVVSRWIAGQTVRLQPAEMAARRKDAPGGGCVAPGGNPCCLRGGRATATGADPDSQSRAITTDQRSPAMTKGRPFLVLAACAAVQLASCGGGGGGGTTLTLAGTLVYDRVPSTAAGLSYAGTVEKPIRGAEVRVVSAENTNTVLASGVTGNDGHYSVSWPTSSGSAVKIVFFARTSSPKVTVQDNTAGKAVYGLISNAVDATTTS